MSTHNITFYGEITKIILNYRQIPSLSVPLSDHWIPIGSSIMNQLLRVVRIHFKRISYLTGVPV